MHCILRSPLIPEWIFFSPMIRAFSGSRFRDCLGSRVLGRSYFRRRGKRLVEEVEVFAWLEADGFSGFDGDLCAGAGVAADAGFAGLDGEDAEAAELDAVACDHALLHAEEDGVYGGLGLDAGEAGALDDALDEILLDHPVTPFGRLA